MTIFVQSLACQRADGASEPLRCPQCGHDHVLGICALVEDTRARQLQCQSPACQHVWTDAVPATYSFAHCA